MMDGITLDHEKLYEELQNGWVAKAMLTAEDNNLLYKSNKIWQA